MRFIPFNYPSPNMIISGKNGSLSVECTASYLQREKEHEEEEQRSDKPKGERYIPLLTYAILLQPPKCLDAVSSNLCICDILLTITAHFSSTEKLNARFHDSSKVQHEQHEAKHHTYSRRE